MTRSGLCVAGTVALASLLSAQAPAVVSPRAAAMPDPATGPHRQGSLRRRRRYHRNLLSTVSSATARRERGGLASRVVEGFDRRSVQQWKRSPRCSRPHDAPLDADDHPPTRMDRGSGVDPRSLTSDETAMRRNRALHRTAADQRRVRDAVRDHRIDVTSGIDTSTSRWSVRLREFRRRDVLRTKTSNAISGRKLVADHA